MKALKPVRRLGFLLGLVFVAGMLAMPYSVADAAGSFTEIKKFTTSAGGHLGWDVDISGDTAIAGARSGLYASILGRDQGGPDN